MSVEYLFLPLLSRLSSVSVVFNLSESLMNVAIVSPIKIPVDRSDLSEDFSLCVFFLFCFVLTTQFELCECCV